MCGGLNELIGAIVKEHGGSEVDEEKVFFSYGKSILGS